VALALAPTGRRIVLLERDPAPPAGGLEAAFDDWERRGASQLRHSHAFLARLRKLLAEEHPALLQALRAAGARELGFASVLPPAIAETYVADPLDEELAVIVSRRSTLEAVIRRHVEADDRVTIRSGVFVQGLVTERTAAGALVVRGFALSDGERVLADLAVDAGGRGSPMIDWLAEAGAAVVEEAEDCAILYYTRFYSHLPGRADPPRGAGPTTGDLGYLKFGVFPADNGTFSITLAVPDVEERLRAAIVRGEVFDQICASLPGVAAWTDPSRAAAVSRVHAMGDLKSRWREMAPKGEPAVLGAVCVGDSLVRTNPLFGRGCSFAAIEAHLLRDVLATTADPAERARLYSARVRAELRPFYQDMLEQDRAAARRARRALEPPRPQKLGARLMRRFIEDGVLIAIREDVRLQRAAMLAFHMLAPPRRWLARPANLARILRVWARGRKANAHLYPPPAGPARSVLLPALGLPLDARLGSAA
jgi:flavin-dependent dehydrogenase